MKHKGLWILLMAALLAGCETVPVTGPESTAKGAATSAPAVGTAMDKPPVEHPRGEVAELEKVLDYYAQARQMAAPELAREQEAARRALARARTDANRVRYALLLTLPGSTATGDEARALELLEPVARGDGALRGLAMLMMTLLQEQRRLETQAQGLQQKLDALLTLERSMTGRDGSAARKK